MNIRPTLAAALVGLVGFAGVSEAAVIRYQATLSGGAESPPVASPGHGTADVIVDTTAHTFTVDVSFADLIGSIAAAHIHGPPAVPGTGTAGVMTATPSFPGFPLGVTSGAYLHSFDMTDAATWNPAFVTSQGSIGGAEAAFLAALAGGTAYLNIHTTFAPGGEIRGFLAPVPLPAGVFLSLSALAVLGAIRMRAGGEGRA